MFLPICFHLSKLSMPGQSQRVTGVQQTKWGVRQLSAAAVQKHYISTSDTVGTLIQSLLPLLCVCSQPIVKHSCCVSFSQSHRGPAGC